MSFDVVINPLTGERAVVRQHATRENGELLVGDLYASPGAAVVGEHLHPRSTETFTIVRGRIELKVGSQRREAGPGGRFEVPAGVSHDWWNAGDETAFVIVEVANAPRFEKMIKNLFFLAADGKTDRKGRPSLLQACLLAREFDDTFRFTKPPRTTSPPMLPAGVPAAIAR